MSFFIFVPHRKNLPTNFLMPIAYHPRRTLYAQIGSSVLFHPENRSEYERRQAHLDSHPSRARAEARLPSGSSTRAVDAILYGYGIGERQWRLALHPSLRRGLTLAQDSEQTSPSDEAPPPAYDTLFRDSEPPAYATPFPASKLTRFLKKLRLRK